MVQLTTPWITPFIKQCFVTLGVAINLGQMGLVLAFPSVLLPQLKSLDSYIPIDDEYGSWLASLPGIAIMIGNLMTPGIMGKFGRKVANISTILLFITSWLGVALATTVSVLLAMRALQGIALGMVFTLGPLLVGEYTSPKNRGAFLMSTTAMISLGVLVIHGIGSYLHWQTTSFICIGITIFNLLLAIPSPESPSWLVIQGRYDECRTNFRWLRGDTEDDELEKMINANVALQKANADVATSSESFMEQMKNNLIYFRQTVKKNEFYKPIIIMFHLYTIIQWSGLNVLSAYAPDYIKTAAGEDVNLPVMVVALDVQRTIFNTIGLIVIKKLKRRAIMFLMISLNIIALLMLAFFTYAKAINLISHNNVYNYYIGVGLINFLTLTIAMGALPMCFILAGEIFPSQYKNIAGGISCLFFAINLFICLKTVPFFLSTIGIYGMYVLYACILIYCLIVLGFILPETKDKTLQDIEEEFKGKVKLDTETEG